MVKNPVEIVAHGVEMLPGMPNLTGPPQETIERQERLRSFAHRLIIVGDFEPRRTARSMRNNAQETATILRHSDVIRGEGVVLAAMGPTTAKSHQTHTDTSEALVDAFEEDQEGPVTWSDRPVSVETRDLDDTKLLPHRTYQALDQTLTPLWRRANMEAEDVIPNTTFVVVASPTFAVRALGVHFQPSDISGGRFIGLRKVGARSKDNTWRQYFYVRPVGQLKQKQGPGVVAPEEPEPGIRSVTPLNELHPV